MNEWILVEFAVEVWHRISMRIILALLLFQSVAFATDSTQKFRLPHKPDKDSFDLLLKNFHLTKPVTLIIKNKLGSVDVEGLKNSRGPDDKSILVTAFSWPGEEIGDVDFVVEQSEPGKMELRLELADKSGEQSTNVELSVKLPSSMLAHLKVESNGEISINKVAGGPQAKRQIIVNGAGAPVMTRRNQASFIQITNPGQIDVRSSKANFLLRSLSTIAVGESEGTMDAILDGKRSRQSTNILQVREHKGFVKAHVKNGYIFLSNPNVSGEYVKAENGRVNGVTKVCKKVLASVPIPSSPFD
jgi:hypothetical protein